MRKSRPGEGKPVARPRVRLLSPQLHRPSATPCPPAPITKVLRTPTPSPRRLPQRQPSTALSLGPRRGPDTPLPGGLQHTPARPRWLRAARGGRAAGSRWFGKWGVPGGRPGDAAALGPSRPSTRLSILKRRKQKRQLGLAYVPRKTNFLFYNHVLPTRNCRLSGAHKRPHPKS